MIAVEREAYMQIRAKKIENSLKDLRKKQKIDMHVLKKKCEAALNERLKFKRAEDAKIVQRYHNIRNDIENQQRRDVNTLEKTFIKYRKGLYREQQKDIMKSSTITGD